MELFVSFFFILPVFDWVDGIGVTSTLLYAAGVVVLVVAIHAGSLDKPIEAEFADEDMIRHV
jgi:hypothetical protein